MKNYTEDKIITYKLFGEFRNLKRSSPPKGISFVAILSAEEIEIEGENGERLKAGIKQSLKYSVPLLFIGTKLHNKFCADYLKKRNIKTKAYFPANRKEATTKTQIKDLAKFINANKPTSVLLVSHFYHIPRIKRYCQKYLNKDTDINFYFIGNLEDQKQQVLVEIKKIISYSKKNDLPLFIK